ncbi:hypothetical protein TVAG_520720 [Trichomonas vaginalis G3]|uniref:Uncharacterized protein n=1 Tax=Trichomonas vaginalis (strain ATCC PRA-98 / G3) TaxID=412133 RepID=A2HIP4_TRIV3|nr:hypothetical protein TVAG_520720 [Trichomonas vaginalis G3]|eukprot:XP_001283651.1 hypothetical protein [Trichomonas vaginalis G3]
MEGFEFMPLDSKEGAEEVVVAAFYASSHVDAFRTYQDDLEKEVESLERSKCCLSSSVETLHRSMRRKNKQLIITELSS